MLFRNCIFNLTDDFSQTDLRTVLPKFHHHLHIPTRERNTMNHVYTKGRGEGLLVSLGLTSRCQSSGL